MEDAFDRWHPETTAGWFALPVGPGGLSPSSEKSPVSTTRLRPVSTSGARPSRPPAGESARPASRQTSWRRRPDPLPGRSFALAARGRNRQRDNRRSIRAGASGFARVSEPSMFRREPKSFARNYRRRSRVAWCQSRDPAMLPAGELVRHARKKNLMVASSRDCSPVGMRRQRCRRAGTFVRSHSKLGATRNRRCLRRLWPSNDDGGKGRAMFCLFENSDIRFKIRRHTNSRSHSVCAYNVMSCGMTC